MNKKAIIKLKDFDPELFKKLTENFSTEDWLNATVEDLIVDGFSPRIAQSLYEAAQELKSGEIEVITDINDYVNNLKKEYCD